MILGRSAVVVDTNVFGAEMTRRGAALAGAYRGHVEGRALYISFVTVAEIRFGARLAGWGEHRLRSLEARLGAAEIVWAGSGLVDEYVALRHACVAWAIPSVRRSTRPTDGWRRPRVGSACRLSRTTPCSVMSRAPRS
ncbi:MAG: PIN domain-containing protein [Acidimicrobiales bacterium]